MKKVEEDNCPKLSFYHILVSVHNDISLSSKPHTAMLNMVPNAT